MTKIRKWDSFWRFTGVGLHGKELDLYLARRWRNTQIWFVVMTFGFCVLFVLAGYAASGGRSRMGYPRDIDDMSEKELTDELARRKRIQAAGLCDYCGSHPSKPACKYPERHHLTAPKKE